MIYMKLVKYTGIFISIVFLFSCEDSSKTSQSEQIQKVDQEFIQYLDKEIALTNQRLDRRSYKGINKRMIMICFLICLASIF